LSGEPLRAGRGAALCRGPSGAPPPPLDAAPLAPPRAPPGLPPALAPPPPPPPPPAPASPPPLARGCAALGVWRAAAAAAKMDACKSASCFCPGSSRDASEASWCAAAYSPRPSARLEALKRRAASSVAAGVAAAAAPPSAGAPSEALMEWGTPLSAPARTQCLLLRAL
jgi:hypothetical protein